jgi:hypothetical protein
VYTILNDSTGGDNMPCVALAAANVARVNSSPAKEQIGECSMLVVDSDRLQKKLPIMRPSSSPVYI